MKKCTRCGETKPLDGFHRDKSNKDGLYVYCKVCACAKTAAWKAVDPQRSSESQRRSRQKNPRVYRNKILRRTFGITLEEYEAMEQAQGGLCAICNQAETEIHPKSKTTRNLAVDHDHGTGQIRGLLCNSCNRALGLFRDNPQTVRSAAEYLERQSPPANRGAD